MMTSFLKSLLDGAMDLLHSTRRLYLDGNPCDGAVISGSNPRLSLVNFYDSRFPFNPYFLVDTIYLFALLDK